MIEPKSSRGKLWAASGADQFLCRMWERLAIKKAWASSAVADADKVRQSGTDGRWQQEMPYKVEFELLRRCTDVRGEVRRSGKLLGSILGQWEARRVDKCEGERLL